MSKIKMFALGGLNEIGKNMYVVEVDNDIYVFEAGLKYADDSLLGIDYIIPDFDYLSKNKKRCSVRHDCLMRLPESMRRMMTEEEFEEF